MTHDPLCFIEHNPLMRQCSICDLIAKVREDMLDRCEEAAYTDLSSLEDAMRESFGKGSDAARIVAGYRSAMPSFRQLHLEESS
jgi:hypothetical protein